MDHFILKKPSVSDIHAYFSIKNSEGFLQFNPILLVTSEEAMNKLKSQLADDSTSEGVIVGRNIVK